MQPLFSSVVSRASAGLLAAGGLSLLFAADVILPHLIPGFPSGAAWLGQLLGAAWLAVAALNWLQRSAILGGIYGRPVVFSNMILYFVSTLSLVKVLQGPTAPVGIWWPLAPMALLAVVYGALLLRGPFDRLPG